MHVRAQLRAALVAALDDIPAVSGRVYSGRVHPVADTALPAILVYVRREDAEDTTINRVRQRRLVEVIVEAFAKATSALDDELDELSEAIEEALLADPTFGGLAKQFRLRETTLTVEDTATQPVGSARHVFTAHVETRAGEPDEVA